MTTWGNICRVCSNPAEYSIFSLIPPYLHETSNEILQWQKKINKLIEETTGLNVSENDGLPQKICALCISYLKHAVTFREQAICNTMNLKATQLLKEGFHEYLIEEDLEKKKLYDKENINVTEADLNHANGHKIDMNLLTNNCKQIQDKVFKQLLGQITAGTLTPDDVEQKLENLSLSDNKKSNLNAGSSKRNFYSKNKKTFNNHCEEDEDSGSESDDECKSNPSSDPGEDTLTAETQNQDVFSYKERNFEEDDVMDCDQLRDIVSYNVIEHFKERKCPACMRRFMLSESYNAHTSSCFEYAFLIFIEDVNRLLKIRRKKAVSPHEFIRRMIFRLRKMCEWLNANSDESLPDITEDCKKDRLNSCATKSSESSSIGVNSMKQNGSSNVFDNLNIEKTANTITTTPKPTAEFHKNLTTTDLLLSSSTNADENVDLFTTSVPIKSTMSTPININNNILYEIERSLSRNSSTHTAIDVSLNAQVMKPVPILGKSAAVPIPDESVGTPKQINTPNNNGDLERMAFLQKLQRACQKSPIETQKVSSPQISVRTDLMPPANENGVKPKEQPIVPMALKFVARCNACGILFQSLAALEVHNATHHNGE